MEKSKSIKYNFIFNFIRVFSGILFPMLTVPYLSRVLQPEGIGKIAFADSIIQYFVLIASLGIPIYGIREIAKVRNNKEELSKKLSELFLINILMTIIAYIIFISLFLNVKKIQTERMLFMIMSFNIIFSTLGIEWYYQGVEKYDYITIRSVLVRIISIVFMFIFVKTKQDYILSATIGVIGNVGSNIYNIYGVRKLINIKISTLMCLKEHKKSILVTFAMVLISSVYIQATYIILGVFQDNRALGYFTTATRLQQVLTVLIISLGTVMIPRLAILIKNKDVEKYNEMIAKLFVFNLVVSLPIVVIIVIFSKTIILILFGKEFIDISKAMKLIIITLPVSSTINILGQQILYPNNEEKKLVYSFVVGAIVSLGMNFLLISKYSYLGAAIASVVTQITVLLIQFFFAKKYFKITFLSSFYKILLSNFILIFFIFVSKKENYTPVTFFLNMFIYMFLYFFILLLIKEKYTTLEFKNIVINKVKKIIITLKGA